MNSETLVRELRNAAYEWSSNHSVAHTFETRYDIALSDAADAIEELQMMLDGVSSDNDALCERINDLTGKEKSGLLIRLPCRVGDMVYYRKDGCIIGNDVKRIVLDGLDNQVIIDRICAYMFSDFGVNVWTSYEEAEVALKGETES